MRAKGVSDKRVVPISGHHVKRRPPPQAGGGPAADFGLVDQITRGRIEARIAPSEDATIRRPPAMIGP